MERFGSSRTWWVARALGQASVLALLAWASVPASPLGGVVRGCSQAQEIDGRLVCDEELAGDLRELCANTNQALAPGDSVTRARDCSGGGQGIERMAPETLAALEQVVDLNEASVDELASLPGIGPVLAGRILAARPFASLDELVEVRGIGTVRLAAIRPRARVGRAELAR